jgi:hypothetical protein
LENLAEHWFSLIKYLEKILDIKSFLLVVVLFPFLGLHSSMVKAYERNATLSENLQLTGVLLSIISLLHVELLSVNQSGDSGFVNLKHSRLWDMQTTAFSILGRVVGQIGSTMPTDLWQSIVEVCFIFTWFHCRNNLSFTKKYLYLKATTLQKEEPKLKI